jgi:hypothetical protein
MISPSTLQSAPPPPSSAPGADGQPPASRRSWFAIGFAVAAVLITAGAIALAALAPTLNSSSAPTAPSGWTQVYDAAPQPGDTVWATTSGCALESAGLHVTGRDNIGIACTFQPSKRQDLLGNGFMLTLGLAPGADVPTALEEALIVLGDSGEVRIDQYGHVAICTPACGERNANVTTVDAFAWHGYAANTITLRWLGPGNDLEVYTNGQRTLTAPFDVTSASRILALGTPKQDEAIYTHVTLYSAG